MGSSSRRRAIAADYPGPGGGTQPRLRADRRVAYSRPPDGSDVPHYRRAACRGSAPARRRPGRGPLGHARRARLPDALRRRRLGRAGGRPRQRAPGLRPAPRYAAHPRLGQQALHHLHRALALRRRRPPDHQRAGRRRRRPQRRAGRQPLPARRRRPELRLAAGGRAGGRPRARPGPARDHRARDRRRVGLRLAARRAVGGLPHHQRGRAAERADLQPRPLGQAPALLPAEPRALRRPRVREGAAPPRRHHRRGAEDRPRAQRRRSRWPSRARRRSPSSPASPTGRRTTSTPRR